MKLLSSQKYNEFYGLKLCFRDWHKWEDVFLREAVIKIPRKNPENVSLDSPFSVRKELCYGKVKYGSNCFCHRQIKRKSIRKYILYSAEKWSRLFGKYALIVVPRDLFWTHDERDITLVKHVTPTSPKDNMWPYLFPSIDNFIGLRINIK